MRSIQSKQARERAMPVADRRRRQIRFPLHRPDPAVGPIVVQDAGADQFQFRADRVEQFHVRHRDSVMPQVFDNAAPDGPGGLLGWALLEQRGWNDALRQQALELLAILGGLLVRVERRSEDLGQRLFLTRSWNVPERVFLTEAMGISFNPKLPRDGNGKLAVSVGGAPPKTGGPEPVLNPPSRGGVEGKLKART